jgi:5-methylcytosine-specific restriction protein A
MTSINLIEGEKYVRTKLHDEYGGNRQSGIASCPGKNIILLFSSPIGKIHGYQDHWITSEYFQYTGEGQYGNMDLVRGNKAIREHISKNRELYLFEKQVDGRYLLLGKFKYESHQIINGKDTDNRERKVIVFKLKKLISN